MRRSRRVKRNEVTPTEVAVIGGSGYLGGKIVKRLVAQNNTNVLSLDIAAPKEEVPGVDYIECNVCDKEALMIALDGVELVFHTSAVIDLSPFPTRNLNGKPKIEEVNIGGTENVIACCRALSVGRLVYTSTGDVVFNGDPKAGVDETEPYAPLPSIYNYYISSKATAEQLVLAADSDALSTAALRPGHIYGPGDAMIAIIIEMRKSGDLPARVGQGTNDYIYVDNLVDAHLEAAASLLEPGSPTKGQAYFICDYAASVWEHMEPFLSTAGLTVPGPTVPLIVVQMIASVVELYYGFMYFFLQMSICGRITRYSVTTTGQDFYTNTDKAYRHFGFEPSVSREQAVAVTNAWVTQVIASGEKPKSYFGAVKARDGLSKQDNAGDAAQIRMLYLVHQVYGYLLVLAGVWLFVRPDDASAAVGIPLGADDAWGRVIVNTSGIIVTVLGLYSVAASAAEWSMTYFRLTYVPKFLTCGALAMHVSNGKMPVAFLVPAAIEAAVGLATVLCLRGLPNPPYKLHFDNICVAQLLHAVLSGAFQIAMLLTPYLALSSVMSADIKESDQAAITWGRFMGAAEIMMTWTYTLSGGVGGLEPFVRLSVVTRLFAFVALAAGWAAGLCVPEQVGGVLGDVVLALITIKCLSWTPSNGRPVYSAISCVL